MLKAISYFRRWDAVPDVTRFKVFVHYQNKKYICIKMAEGYQSPLQHPGVKLYFETILDVTKSFVRSLNCDNLITDAQKEKILQQTTPKDKAKTSHDILIQNFTEEMMPILNKVLRDHNLRTIEQMMTLGQHDKGKIIEFSRTQVLQINRYFVNEELKNAAQIFQKMVPDTNVFEMKDRQPTDILLDLVKDDTNKVWATFISLLQEFGNEAMANRLEKMICAECYRTTIINDLKSIAVEIDTDFMEETFKGKPIPKAVLDKCIATKGELPRVERAKYFLQYVLLKGEMVSAFADVLSYSTKVVLNFSPCETHGGKSKIAINDVDKEFSFLVCKNGTDHFTLTRTQEADDVLSKGSKSLNYVVQHVASKRLSNGNISGNLEDEQILSKEEILHKYGGKNGLPH